MGNCVSSPVVKQELPASQELPTPQALNSNKVEHGSKAVQPVTAVQNQGNLVQQERFESLPRSDSALSTKNNLQPSKAPACNSSVSDVEAPTDVDSAIRPEDAPAKGLPYQVALLGPPCPPCNDERVKTVKALDVMDAPPDPEVESILKLISSIFQAPAVLCAFFGDRQIFVKEAGGIFQRGDFPWRSSFCAWTMTGNTAQTLVIEDTHQDARFSENPNVLGPANIRFYCGTPLVASNGHRLGTICFADHKPRTFDAGSCMILNNLAEMVVRHLEKDIALQLKQQSNSALIEVYSKLKRAIDCFERCVVLIDTASTSGWSVLYANMAFTNMTGLQRGDAINSSFSDLFEDTRGHVLPSTEHSKLASQNSSFTISKARVKSTGTNVVLKFRPASKDTLDDAIPVGAPAFLNQQAEGARHYYFVMIEPAKKQDRISWSGASIQISDAGEPIEGLQLGSLLGKGAFGSVYSGTWLGTSVAVKIIDHDLEKAANGVLAEVALGSELRHPYIVSNLKSVTRRTGIMKAESFKHHSTLGYSSTTWSSSCYSSDAAGAISAAPIKPSAVPDAAATNSTNPTKATDICAVNAEQATNNNMNGIAAGGWGIINVGRDLSEDGNIVQLWPGTESAVHLSGAGGGADCGSHGPASGKPKELLQTWIIMEYCDRGSLQDAVDKGWLRDVRSCVRGKPNMAAILATAHEMASALKYLHGKGIIHGDLSAWNVMLTSAGPSASAGDRNFVAKIADFGLSRNLDIQTKIQTKTYGTITHMPQETLTAGTISKATDVYSFGVLCWQMYTGSRPYAGMSHGQIIMHVVMRSAQLRFPPDAPAGFVALVEQCISHEPEQRPTFSELLTVLEELQQQL